MENKIQISSLYGEFKNHPKESEPSEKEYGCEVCKYADTCEPNPFGICNKFERK